MANHFLFREVKTDKRGLFVYYGGWRYHPQGKTRANLGVQVKLESPFRRSDTFAVVHVSGHKEVWRQVGKPNNEVPFFSKRIRGTDHTGYRPGNGGYVTLIRC